MIKSLPSFNPKEAKYRPRERQELVKALYRSDRLIALQGLYGDGKETIAKSALRFVSDRKVFPGGILYMNLQREMSCRTFFYKLK